MISTKLPMKQKIKDQNQFDIYLMGGNFIWSTTKDLFLVFCYLIFFCDLDMYETDFASYADDNTRYVSGDSIDDVI